MKRMRAALIAAMCFFAADARADWHEAADGTWTFRAEQAVQEVRSDVAVLVKPAPKASGCACGEFCPCAAAGAPVAVAASPVSGHWERQRVGIFRSRDVWVSDAPAVQYSPGVTYTLPTSGSQCPGGVCPPNAARGIIRR